MARRSTPMRWPAGWSDLSPIRDSPFDYILADSPETARRLSAQAEADGLRLTVAASPPSFVEMIPGDWPGIKLSPGDSDRVAAGPTGQPWIDSNGWRILLAAALKPDREIWVDASPAEPRLAPENYLAALAEAAAHGARWILRLDNRMAGAIAARDPAGVVAWTRLAAAARFFADWRWPDLRPCAWIGVVSNFAGPSEFLGHETLNLLARANQPYRVIPLAALSPATLSGLKSVLLIDEKPPSSDARRLLNGFAEQGGLLVAGPAWAQPPGPAGHPRYHVRRAGAGRIAVSLELESDPYLLVQDAIVLLSHRHDLVRLWNASSARGCLSVSSDRRKALLQMIFYANARGGDASVRIAGDYRTARLFTPDATPRELPVLREKDAVEVHLPAVGQYGAVELAK